jgi:hypothetical protein
LGIEHQVPTENHEYIKQTHVPANKNKRRCKILMAKKFVDGKLDIDSLDIVDVLDIDTIQKFQDNFANRI